MANVNVDNNKMWFIEPGCAVISHGRYGDKDNNYYAISIHASPKCRNVGAIEEMTEEEAKECVHVTGLVFKNAEHMRGYLESMQKLYDLILEDEKTKDMRHPLSIDFILNEVDDLGSPVWVEFFSGALVPMVITNCNHQYGEQILDGNVYKLADYGRTWRVWKDKPTKEEREAHAWRQKAES